MPPYPPPGDRRPPSPRVIPKMPAPPRGKPLRFRWELLAISLAGFGGSWLLARVEEESWRWVRFMHKLHIVDRDRFTAMAVTAIVLIAGLAAVRCLRDAARRARG